MRNAFECSNSLWVNAQFILQAKRENKSENRNALSFLVCSDIPFRIGDISLKGDNIARLRIAGIFYLLNVALAIT